MSDVTIPADLSQGQAKDTSSQQSASSEGQSPQQMASQAQDKVREGASMAQDKVSEQIQERAKQAGERVSGTAGDLRSVGEELRKQGKDGPAKIADRAAEQSEKVGSYLSDSSPDQILHDVEDFGRKRPAVLLAGGLLAGAAAARFLKASSRGRYQQRSALRS